ncbi:MAG: YcxB family protein [Tropicimonas sp.]|uniref:YcxB family protein n=1 Tax=Tropicimonas sp. TaxID=2067044 RepID=UPI003A8A99DB
MAQNRRITVTYTKAIVSDAVRTFVWRRAIAGQKWLWAGEAAMIVLFAWLVWRGERGWPVGVIGIAVLLPPFMVVAIWAAHYSNTVGKFRRMTSNRADFRLGDDGFEVTSELGGASLPWSGITGIWERPGYWMLFTAPNQFLTLPLANVSAADRDFVLSRLSPDTNGPEE